MDEKLFGLAHVRAPALEVIISCLETWDSRSSLVPVEDLKPIRTVADLAVRGRRAGATTPQPRIREAYGSAAMTASRSRSVPKRTGSSATSPVSACARTHAARASPSSSRAVFKAIAATRVARSGAHTRS